MEANELQTQIAYKLANDTAFKAAVNTIIGEDINVIVGEDVGNGEPDSDYPCIVFSVKQQTSDEDTVQNSIRFSIILESEMKWETIDGYRQYSDNIKPEKVAKEIYGLVKKLCFDKISYFYEIPDQYIQDESVKGSLEITTSDKLSLKDNSW